MNLFLKPIYWLLIVVFCLHIFVAAIPQNHLAWDEVYYQPASVDVLHGVAVNLEHPPLVKLMAAVSIGVIGDGWLAWRLPIVLFAMLATAMTYLIARKFLSERASLFAAALLSCSLIFMYLGSLLILDMPFIALALYGIYFGLRGKFGLSGLMFGLSFLCKELAVLIFLPTLIYFISQRVGKYKLLWFSAVGFLVAFLGMWIFDLVYQPMISGVLVSNPVQNFAIWIHYQFNLNGLRNTAGTVEWTTSYPPISWVSPFGANAFNPQKWIYLSVGGKTYYSFMLQPNAAIEYLMFPLLVLLPVAYWIKRNGLALLSWLCLSFTFLPWFVVGFFVRTESNFYVGYSVPFIVIGSAYLYSFISNRKLKYALAVMQLGIALIWFIYYFPIRVF